MNAEPYFAQIPLVLVEPDPDQPRRSFSDESLQELAASIQEHGVLQPITLEANGSGPYLLRIGERRWRAAGIAGLDAIPALVLPASKGAGRDRLLMALVENLQREDLNPIDEAQAYQRLADAELTIAEISRRCSVSAARVNGRLILLQLDPEIQQLIASGQLHKSPAVAQALLSIPDRAIRVRYATDAARRRFTIKGILAGGRRIAALLEAEQLEKQKTPSLAFAIHRRAAEWNLIQQVQLDTKGRLPPWQTVRLAAEATCGSCELRETASKTVCNTCPGVEIVANMIEIEANRARKKQTRPAH